MALALGIDIGGSGIKAAPVDLERGEFAADRYRIPTPYPATPQAVAETCEELISYFAPPREIPIGITFPAPIKAGTVGFIANLDQSWKGLNVPELFSTHLDRHVTAVNDADAAGYAEAAYGAARDQQGLVIVTTLGTGIGSALIYDGVLIPNTELGHVELNGHVAEHQASSGVREQNDWSFKKWAKKLQKYYAHIDKLFSPDLIVVGGGVSKHHAEFLPLIKVRCPIVPARLRNQAGIVGAAALAAQAYHN